MSPRKRAGEPSEAICRSLSSDPDGHRADRFLVSRHRRQGPVHRRGWRHAGRSQAGVLVFASGQAAASWPSTLSYGALFGLFCYATFELTALSLLKHWTWTVVAVDVSWGVFVTAVSSTLGLIIADWLTPKV